MGGVMRRPVAIATGAAVAALLTHGMVYTAMDLTEPLPILSYQGSFQHALFAMERLWSQVHGWESMSHIEYFGLIYSRTVHLLCPLIGFGLFWIISRHKVGPKLWRPLAMALILTTPLNAITLAPFRALGFGGPWPEVGRTLVIVLAMVGSVGGFRISTPGWLVRETPRCSG